MRRLIVTENITLDGVIDASEGWFAPSGDGGDEFDLEAAIGEQSAAADAFLVGRVTFEEMREYWPRQEDDTTGVSDYLNRVDKYVVSATIEDPEWENTTVIGLDPLARIEELKQADGGDIVTTGSIRLVRALVEAGLADEFRLFTYPLALGRGARLFEGAALPRMRLAEAREFRNGVVLTRYET